MFSKIKITKVAFLGFFFGLLIFQGCSKVDRPAYDQFAQCLADQGLKMYGAFWCSACSSQKKLFGSSFQYVDYIECDDRDPSGKGQAELCKEKNIESYPTWTYTDGRKWVGVQTFEKLGSIANCPVPPSGDSSSNSDPTIDITVPSE